MTAYLYKTLSLLGILVLLQAFWSCEKSTLAEEEQEIIFFLSENQLPYEEIPPGIFIHRLQNGSGAIRPDQTVEVIVEGRLLDGTVFYETNTSPRFIALDSSIVAWRAALPQLQVGARALILTPSEFAYGSKAVAGIPPSTPLLFEVEVLEVHPHF